MNIRNFFRPCYTIVLVCAVTGLLFSSQGMARTISKWIGTAPWCAAQPSDCTAIGWNYVQSSSSGCWSGKKVLCRSYEIKPGQKWLGTAPFCAATSGDCKNDLGMSYVLSARCGDGACCASGKKVLCEPISLTPGQKWIGTAPLCAAKPEDCKNDLGMSYVLSATCGEGACCLSGKKVLCEPIDDTNAQMQTGGGNSPSYNWPVTSPAGFTVKIFEESSATAQHPSIEYTVPENYKILGGGARVNWSGAGNLLTASYPKNVQTWVAKSKDHGIVSPANILVRVIALYDPKDEWDVQIWNAPSSTAAHPRSSVKIPEEYILTGGGAYVVRHVFLGTQITEPIGRIPRGITIMLFIGLKGYPRCITQRKHNLPTRILGHA